MFKILPIFSIMFCLLLSACERQVSAPSKADQPRRYELRGKVLKVEKEQKRIEVAHEKIEGFMDAMTMPFAVKDDAAMEKLQVGNQITATLIFNPANNLMWLEKIAVV